MNFCISDAQKPNVVVPVPLNITLIIKSIIDVKSLAAKFSIIVVNTHYIYIFLKTTKNRLSAVL